jgi:hypothetical protein
LHQRMIVHRARAVGHRHVTKRSRDAVGA